MEENQIRRIPVVEDDGTLVGIISLADIAQAEMVDPAKAGTTFREISEPSIDASKPRAEEDKH
jgi:predicted transcriptional regulator